MYARHHVLYTEENINQAIGQMAIQISNDYAGTEITLAGVLLGGGYLLTHLMTAIERIGRIKACHMDTLRVASYGQDRKPGALNLLHGLQGGVQNKNLIIVDDVADTLNTLAFLRSYILSQNPASIKIAVLLEKVDQHQRGDVEIDYVGIIAQKLGYIYGCGMDLDGNYRGLPFIAEVRNEHQGTS